MTYSILVFILKRRVPFSYLPASQEPRRPSRAALSFFWFPLLPRGGALPAGGIGGPYPTRRSPGPSRLADPSLLIRRRAAVSSGPFHPGNGRGALNPSQAVQLRPAPPSLPFQRKEKPPADLSQMVFPWICLPERSCTGMLTGRDRRLVRPFGHPGLGGPGRPMYRARKDPALPWPAAHFSCPSSAAFCPTHRSYLRNARAKRELRSTRFISITPFTHRKSLGQL